jgi:hypothetical protein
MSTKKGVWLAFSFLMIIIAGTSAVMGQDSKTAAGGDKNVLWKDSATGLEWMVKDNGESVSPNQGHAYCKSLNAGGHSDWRLPTIDELEAVYDSKQSV